MTRVGWTWARFLTQSPDGLLHNVTLNLGSGGAVAGTDGVGGVDYQVVKIGHSATGVAPTQTSLTNPLPTRSTGATSTCSNVAGNAGNVTVLASAAGRLRAWLYNDSTSNVYVKFGATASATSFTKKLLPNEFFTVEGYTGIIDAIWDSATGSMRITELTA